MWILYCKRLAWSSRRLFILLLLTAAWHMLGACLRSSRAAEVADAPAIDVLPTPKEVQIRPGRLTLGGAEKPSSCLIVAGPEAGFAAEYLADKLAAPIGTGARSGLVTVTLRVDANMPLAGRLPRDARPEAYRLEVGAGGVEIAAAEPEGLLRGAATLVQLLQSDGGVRYLPQVTINDWPDFRYRCASDWLLNVEVNRWSYDWGDGPAACLARLKRKLDRCFAYKINQVWFDGFGWDIARCAGYADLVRECSQYARRRGIKLTFAGYGGGYGTSYQQSEIYRCGYFGQTFINRRPYPAGEEYACRGMDRLEQSRRYGSCLSNEALCRAKLDEMKRFAAAVEPGFMYIHDIDSGTFAESQKSWLLRCEECRKRWPSDELAAPEGQAGALAAWYRQIRTALDGVFTPSGYRAARDLTLIFTSPLYTCYYEKGPPDLWDREIDYFCLLSRLMGTADHVEFGLREQFYDPKGGKKIARLRAAMDKSGGQAAIHVIAFGGGDNYLSNDLTNVSGLMAPFYHGAESVCLSNGGVHEEPVQLLNAEILWAGSAAGYRETPGDEAAAQALFRRIQQGRHRPAAVFGPEGLLHRICARLWGEAAGEEMYRAYLAAGESGDGPLSRVWWAATADVARLRAVSSPAQTDWEERHARWLRRKAATDDALVHARRAAALSEDEDVRWFASSLALGSRFCECMALSIELRLRADAATRSRLEGALGALESQIMALGRNDRTEPLGGDPGCWLETLGHLKSLHSASADGGRWPRFRGANGAGISDASTVPAKWTEADYSWKIELPGIGHSSPVVWNDRIFVTCGDSATAGRTVLCVDAADGHIVWRRDFPSKPGRQHRDNSYATATPAVDADGLIVTWTTPDDVVLLALDLEGRELWRRNLGPFITVHGSGSSPILFGDLAILVNDQEDPNLLPGRKKDPPAPVGKSFIIAVDRKTGQTRWQLERRTTFSGYSTPCVRQADDGRPELIFTSTAHGIFGVDPTRGAVNWEFGQPFLDRAISSPVLASGLVIAGHGAGLRATRYLAVRPGSRGQGREPVLAYEVTKSIPLVPTPLVKDDRLFFWTDDGVASCLKASSGEEVWRERVGGSFYGSPVWVNGRLYCISKTGEVVVLAAADKFELLARVPLGESSYATPAVAGGVMYLRTSSHLFSLGGKD